MRIYNFFSSSLFPVYIHTNAFFNLREKIHFITKNVRGKFSKKYKKEIFPKFYYIFDQTKSINYFFEIS